LEGIKAAAVTLKNGVGFDAYMSCADTQFTTANYAEVLVICAFKGMKSIIVGVINTWIIKDTYCQVM